MGHQRRHSKPWTSAAALRKLYRSTVGVISRTLMAAANHATCARAAGMQESDSFSFQWSGPITLLVKP
jgi:hypothetical protein